MSASWQGVRPRKSNEHFFLYCLSLPLLFPTILQHLKYKSALRASLTLHDPKSKEFLPHAGNWPNDDFYSPLNSFNAR